MMDLEEAIKTALDFENSASDVYHDLADKFESPVARKIFKALGEEEEGHVAYLNAKLEEWRSTGKITAEKLETIVPDKQTIESNLKKLGQPDERKDLTAEIEAFKKALNLEVEASNFFRNLVSKLSAENQQLFERFVEIEEGHEAIIQTEIDHAQGLGYWFDFMEFNLEAG